MNTIAPVLSQRILSHLFLFSLSCPPCWTGLHLISHGGAQFLQLLILSLIWTYRTPDTETGSHLVWAPFPDISTVYYSFVACLLCLLCVCVSRSPSKKTKPQWISRLSLTLLSQILKLFFICWPKKINVLVG